MEKLGIEGIKKAMKESKELLTTVELVLDDGKLSIGDAKYIPDLWSDTSDLLAASPQALAEAKDIDLEEAKILIADSMELVFFMFEKIKNLLSSVKS